MPETPHQFGLFIDRKWVTPEGSSHFETRNPATGEVLARFVSGRGATDAAVEAAQRAFPAWCEVPAPDWGEILQRAAQILLRRKDEVGRIVTRRWADPRSGARGRSGVHRLHRVHGRGGPTVGRGDRPFRAPQQVLLTVRQPKGVVACITPWNFPTAIPNWKIAAALICGNTVVFKPVSNTAWCGAEVVRVYEEAGGPPGSSTS